jgi:hypothetical protein
MMTPQTIREYVNAEPFRPFRLHLASGQTFEVRHPTLIKVLKNYVLIFNANGENPEFPDEFKSVSLLLTESISDL